MAIAKIEKQHWHDYFDRVSKVLVGKNAELEVEALAIGSQVQAEWLPLTGIVYDARADILAVMVEGFDHMIRHPQTVFADMTGSALTSMEVIDADQAHHIVRLRDPLMLPPPG